MFNWYAPGVIAVRVSAPSACVILYLSVLPALPERIGRNATSASGVARIASAPSFGLTSLMIVVLATVGTDSIGRLTPLPRFGPLEEVSGVVGLAVVGSAPVTPSPRFWANVAAHAITIDRPTPPA